MIKRLLNIVFISLLYASSRLMKSSVNAVVIPEDKDSFVMPEYLNTDTFYSQVSKKLTIVEFFSPYCSHCKTLAPIWKDVVQTFSEKGMDKEYGIEFKQVDCIQSGDLCSDEDIGFYPYIRLYGPEKDGFDKDALVVSKYHLKDYPSDFKRTKDDIIKFAKLEGLKYNSIEEMVSEADDQNEEFHTSDEEVSLTNDELVSIISDIDVTSGKPMIDNDSPWIIVFTDKHEKSNSVKWWESDPFFKKNWKPLKKEADVLGIKTASYKCKSSNADELNEDICNEIFSDDVSDFPKLVVLTPKKKINKLFTYDKLDMGGFSNKKIIDFAMRVNHNSYIPEISSLDIGSFINQRKISNEPVAQSRDEKIYVVFQYDAETVTSEDFDFLEHLILPLSKIPNLYLFKTSFDLEKFNKRQVEKIVANIKNEGHQVEYNTNMITNKLLSQVPTFHIYKENSMVPSTYRCFSTVDLRDLKAVLNWVYRDTLPSIIELKDTNAEYIFDFDKKDYEQVVLFFLDSAKNLDEISQDIHTYRINYEYYELERWNYQYESLNEKRKSKEDKINKLKNEVTGSDRRVLFKEMKKEIILNDFEKRAIFAVVDTRKYPLNEYNFIHEALNGYSKVDQLKPGSLLVIDNAGYVNEEITVFDKELSLDELDDTQELKLKEFSLAELLVRINLNKKGMSQNAYETIKPNVYIKVHSLNKKGLSITTMFGILMCFVGIIGMLKRNNKAKGKPVIISLLHAIVSWPFKILGLFRDHNGKIRFFGRSRKNKASLTYNEVGLLEKSS
ncbi:hypothetical protein ACO0R3_000138 [Hanseniaspora guilliermondii]